MNEKNERMSEWMNEWKNEFMIKNGAQEYECQKDAKICANFEKIHHGFWLWCGLWEWQSHLSLGP